MTARRFLILLAAGLVAIAGATYLSSRSASERDSRGGTLVAGLSSRLDALTEVQLRKSSAKPTVTLHRTAGGQWLIAERDSYPADASKVRKLLIALGDAHIVEEKTANPANYAVLGVDDPANASSTSTEVALIGPQGVTKIVIGRGVGTGNYARVVGIAASAVIEPAIEAPGEAREWIDPKLLDIALDKVRSIRATLADGASYVISRKKVTDAFALEQVPPGREANDASLLTPSPTTLSGVTADDVASASSVDFSKAANQEIQLFDGSDYRIQGTVQGERHWVRIDPPASDTALAAKTKDRAFDIANYRYDALFRPLEQLLKPKLAKPAAPPKKPAAKNAATP